MNPFTDFNADLKNHSLLKPKLYKMFASSVIFGINKSCLFCGVDASQKDESGEDYMRVLEIDDIDCQTGVAEIRTVPVCEDCSVICSKIIEFQKKRDEVKNEK